MIKDFTDILLGILAWSIALITYFLGSNFGSGLIGAPLLWIASVVSMHKVRRRPAWHFWWVWPSAFLAFSFWWSWGAWIFFGGFAP